MEIVMLISMVLVGILLIRNGILQHQRDSNIAEVQKLTRENRILEDRIEKMEIEVEELTLHVKILEEIEDFTVKTASKFIGVLAFDLDRKRTVGYSHNLLSVLDVIPMKRKEFGSYVVDYELINSSLLKAAPEKSKPNSTNSSSYSSGSFLSSSKSSSSNRNSDDGYSPSYSYNISSDCSSYDSYDSSSSSSSSSDSSSSGGGFCD